MLGYSVAHTVSSKSDKDKGLFSASEPGAFICRNMVCGQNLESQLLIVCTDLAQLQMLACRVGLSLLTNHLVGTAGCMGAGYKAELTCHLVAYRQETHMVRMMHAGYIITYLVPVYM